jgi:hypothetical protein
MAEDLPKPIEMRNLGETARGDEDHLTIHRVSLRMSVSPFRLDQMRVQKRQEPFLKGLHERRHIEIV